MVPHMINVGSTLAPWVPAHGARMEINMGIGSLVVWVQAFSVRDASWSCKIDEGAAGLAHARWTPDCLQIVWCVALQLAFHYVSSAKAISALLRRQHAGPVCVLLAALRSSTFDRRCGASATAPASSSRRVLSVSTAATLLALPCCSSLHHAPSRSLPLSSSSGLTKARVAPALRVQSTR